MSKQSERRRRAVRAFAPAVGLLAAGLLVWQGSYAAFSATTDNTGSTWGSGALNLQNNGGTAGTYAASTTAGFGGTDIKPGDTGTECLTVDSTGSTAGGSLRMWGALETGYDAGLAAQLGVTVVAIKTTVDVTKDCVGFPVGTTTSVFNSSIDSLPANYAAATPFAIASGDKVAYKLTWTFNTTGTTAGDNLLQSKSVAADFTWELQ